MLYQDRLRTDKRIRNRTLRAYCSYSAGHLCGYDTTKTQMKRRGLMEVCCMHGGIPGALLVAAHTAAGLGAIAAGM